MSWGRFRFALVLEGWLEASINFKLSLPFHYVAHRESQVDPQRAIYAEMTAMNGVCSDKATLIGRSHLLRYLVVTALSAKW